MTRPNAYQPNRASKWEALVAVQRIFSAPPPPSLSNPHWRRHGGSEGSSVSPAAPVLHGGAGSWSRCLRDPGGCSGCGGCIPPAAPAWLPCSPATCPAPVRWGAKAPSPPFQRGTWRVVAFSLLASPQRQARRGQPCRRTQSSLLDSLYSYHLPQLCFPRQV